MKANKILEYKASGKTNISARKPVIIGQFIYTAYLFNEHGKTASQIICLDKNTFELRWEYYYPFVINNLAQVNSTNLMVCCMDGKLLELDSSDGTLIRTINLHMLRCGASSDIVDDKLIVGGVQGTTLTACFNFNTGKQEWSFSNGGHSYTPLVSENKAYQCTENIIHCFDFNSGELLWKAQNKKNYLFNPIQVDNLIVVGGHGIINCYHTKKGRLVLQIKLPTTGLVRSIMHHDNCLYFGDSTGGFYAYSLVQQKSITGRISAHAELLWSINTYEAIENIPVVLNNKIFFANNDNKLFCFNKANGDLLWKFNTQGKAGISGVVIEDNYLYTAVGNGYIYKLQEA